MVPDTVAPLAGAVIATVGSVVSTLLTVTVTPVAVVVLPAASRATAVSVWLPLVAVVVFQRRRRARRVLGAQVRAVQLELHAGDADVVRGGGRHRHRRPETVAPSAGAVIETVGGDAVRIVTVTVTLVEVVVLPAASRATAVSVWLPLVAVVVFQDDRVRRRRVFGAEVGAVQLELHADDPDVVGGVRGHRHRRAADGAPSAGAVIDTVGAVVSALLTVTVTPSPSWRCPRRHGRRRSACGCRWSAVVVFQVTEYGAAVSSAPRFAPSSLNWTPGHADVVRRGRRHRDVAPDTVAPLAGCCTLTAGAVVSGAAATRCSCRLDLGRRQRPSVDADIVDPRVDELAVAARLASLAPEPMHTSCCPARGCRSAEVLDVTSTPLR